MSTINLRSTRVPKDAYEELSFIESTGTQYIDTGIELTSEYTVELDYQLTETGQQRRGLFGKLIASTGRFGSLLSPTSPYNLEHGYGTSNVYWQQGGQDTDRHYLKQEKNKIYFDGELVYTFATATFSIEGTVALGNFGYTNYNPAKAKYYSSKWWNGNTLVRNFIPARRIYDSVVGWYDTVTCTFFENIGTGTFTAGEVVPTVSEITIQHLPTGYTKLDYIESSGTQWIDTGITDLDNLIWELDWQSTNATTQTAGTGSGSRSASNNRFQIVIDSVGIGNGYYEFAWNTDRHTHILDNKNVKCYIDGVEHTSATSSTSFTRATTSSYHVYIGKRNSYTGDTGVQAKFYSSRFWRDSTLIHNFIPAKRDSDSAIGMYDLVTKTFFENAGTGIFTAGDETSNPNDIQQLSLNNNIIWTKAPEIPSIYTQKNYLQSSGTQYIDTGVVFDSSTDKVVVEFFSSETGNYKWSFGAYSSPNGIGVTSGSNWSSDLFYYTPYTVSSSLLKNTKHTFTADTNGCYVDTTKVASYRSFSISNTLYLFGCNTGSESSANRSSSTIYSFKFYRNNVLLRDFIPAVRNSDSEIGMYERVTDTFYTNSGEGSFTAGD